MCLSFKHKFEALDDGSKLSALLHYGNGIPASPSTSILKSKKKKVPGCTANVYLETCLSLSKNTVSLVGDADAKLVRGMVGLIARVIHNCSITQVLSIDPSCLTNMLGIRSVLTTGRNDGVANIVRVVQDQLREIVEMREGGYGGVGIEDAEDVEGSVGAGAESEGLGKRKIAVLLSGGVDSSVALCLLKSAGHDCTAFYLKIWLEDELAHLGECPWEDDWQTCQQVCEQLGVPLEAVSLQKEYKQHVVDYTVSEAASGRTPNPDVLCNSRVKFGCFYDFVDQLGGFDLIATGHYAQVVRDGDGYARLFRAPDPIKDQSYFLCCLSQRQLKRAIFPIGSFTKTKVRDFAQQFCLPNRARPDSQGLCFLGKVKFDAFIGTYLGSNPGLIKDAMSGEIIGEHNGLWFHTVGQRKGLGGLIDAQKNSLGPWFVVGKDVEDNSLLVTNTFEDEGHETSRKVFNVHQVSWTEGSGNCVKEVDVLMKIRHGPSIVKGRIKCFGDKGGVVTLEEKVGGLADGQFIAFYSEEGQVIGKGVIGRERTGSS